MRTLLALLLLCLSAGSPAAQTVQVQVFMHCEEPSVPDTPNFKTMSPPAAADASSSNSYIHWRNQLKSFADMCHARGIRLNYQSDWNFLEGCWKFEVKTPITNIKNNTGGLTIIQYLESLGHEVDPHSHEGNGYTYADVAFLVTKCGGTDTRVVGGHRLDPDTFAALDYDRLTAPGGVAPGIYTAAQPDPANVAPNWVPVLFMGGASASHENDPVASGIWRPQSASAFHTDSGSTTGTPAIGGWNRDLRQIASLGARLRSGTLQDDGRLWTASVVINHRDIVSETDLQTTVRATLDTLKTWQDEGWIRTTGFREVLDVIWPGEADSRQRVYQRADDHVSFSLNWQEFYLKHRSAEVLERILDHHESLGLPLDVFFTTWQTDIIADEYPDLMGRLTSSAQVSPGYHLRPPLPYDNTCNWGAVLGPSSTSTAAQKRATIQDYETHRLDPMAAVSHATAVPDPTRAGGSGRLAELFGYPPVCVGIASAAALQEIVNDYFHDPDDQPSNGAAGSKMIVRHTNFTNLGQRWSQPTGSGYVSDQNHLFYRPEHYDWKLITLWDGAKPDYAPSQTLADCLDAAHAKASSGGRAPWFVGVKLHDSDLFMTSASWGIVWPNPAQESWDLSRLVPSLELDQATQAQRMDSYLAIVTQTAAEASADRLNVVNSVDLMSYQGEPMARTLSLSRTKIIEEASVGTLVAGISGGGIVSGQALRYSLAPGPGDDDNADFAVSGPTLVIARRLSQEAKATRHLRLRWEWIDSISGATVLASGERPMTLVLQNSTADDDDADGMTEAEEAIAGTDPADPASLLKIDSLSLSPDDGASLAFFARAGRSYRLESSTNLTDWTPVTDVEAGHVALSAGPASVRDLNPAPGRKFYRLAVSVTP